MEKFKTSALAGIFALSTSFAAPVHADTIGCSFSTDIDEVVLQLEEVIAALQQWLSNRAPGDLNYTTVSGHLSTAQAYLANLSAGSGSKGPLPASGFACTVDVSPA